MSHVFHPDLPGYDDRQVWFDGCEECEHRGQRLPDSIGSLDTGRFVAAWKRADEFGQHGADPGTVGRVSDAELPLLELLRAVQMGVSRALVHGDLDLSDLW